MFKNVLRFGNFARGLCRRTFLSEAYKCLDVWEHRLNAEIFQKINFDDLYYQLDRAFQIGYKISVLDVDLYASGINADESYSSELEDILLRLRLNPETGSVYNSTHHAVIRYYMAVEKYDDLIRILSDTFNYGIFPDPYMFNFMLDTFLKKEQYLFATRVSVLNMLQEDFSNAITTNLSLYSCIKYLNSSQVWELPKEESGDDDEEDVRVRVYYLRNPYFDNHFDIKKPNHLVGKTLLLAGEHSDVSIKYSCQIIGLSLYEKYQDLHSLVRKIISEKLQLHKETVERCKEYITAPPKGAEIGEQSEDVKKVKDEVMTLLEELLKSGNLVSTSLEGDIEKEVKKCVEKLEQEDIKKQTEVYKQWEIEREENIKEEIFEDQKQKALEEIEKTKVELEAKEDEIFYFDNEEKWEMLAEEKEKRKLEMAAKKPKKSLKQDEEYIPPEVKKKYKN